MLIRDMLPGEEDAVSRVYALAWKAGYRGIVPDDYLDALPLNHWTPMLTNSPLHSLVAVENGEPVATVCLSPARDGKLPSWGEIISCYVLPQHWSKGYGSVLLKVAAEALQSGGFQNSYLWVLEQNARARAFYEKNGFSCTGDAEQQEIGGRDLTEVRYVRRATGPE